MFKTFQSFPSFLVFLSLFAAAVLTFACMPAFIKLIRKKHAGQQVRTDGPETHLQKQGTPTMGGVVMVLVAVVVSIFIGGASPIVKGLSVAFILTCLLGLADDLKKITQKKSDGLSPKAKIVGQFFIAAAFIMYAVNVLDVSPTIDIPFVTTIDLSQICTYIPVGTSGSFIRIPWIYFVYCMFLLVGLCNAVNLTDGLDGLAPGSLMLSLIAVAGIAYRSDELAICVVCAALSGACIGFLWYNTNPAEIFMGDTGSLAFGMALGCLAIVTKTEFIILIIGGLYVVEALSVMIQVAHYKRTHKRLFLMAPLHHHFEKKGWSENTVVVRFWMISGILAAFGFAVFFASSVS